MNFVITNMTGLRNKGCEAMVRVIVEQLRARYKSAKFVVFSGDPAYDRYWLQDSPDVEVLPTPGTPGGNGVARKIYNDLKKTLKKATAKKDVYDLCFAKADLVLSIGGDVFSSEYSGLKRHISQMERAFKLKKPVMLFAHSVGPFKSDEEVAVFKDVAKHFALMTVREGLSLKYVQDMRIPKVPLHQTADPAFVLKAADSATLERLWDYYHIPKTGKVIAVSLSQGIAGYVNSSSQNHADLLKRFLSQLVRLKDTHVVFVPHVLERTVGNNDAMICDQMLRALNYPSNVTVLSLQHSTEELKGMIGKCDFLVAERMHAAIAGLSQCVPTLVIGYSVKARGILEDVYPKELVNDYLISVTEMDKRDLYATFEIAYAGAQKVQGHMRAVMPDIKKRSLNNFELIEKLLGKK